MLRLPSFPIVQLNLPPPHLLQTACAMFIKRALVQRLGVGGGVSSLFSFNCHPRKQLSVNIKKNTFYVYYVRGLF